jgi:hypothetical protein
LKNEDFHYGLVKHNVGWKDLVAEYILYFQMGPQEDILALGLAFEVFSKVIYLGVLTTALVWLDLWCKSVT